MLINNLFGFTIIHVSCVTIEGARWKRGIDFFFRNRLFLIQFIGIDSNKVLILFFLRKLKIQTVSHSLFIYIYLLYASSEKMRMKIVGIFCININRLLSEKLLSNDMRCILIQGL